jgi:hypothetical protein
MCGTYIFYVYCIYYIKENQRGNSKETLKETPVSEQPET